ncbi:MAG: hypothetical protein KatS3mg110_1675 [Pirellulaceae bacterium]|nr:MAG: hypothetical protein KatS3mg110_1675 [Pirellulaceae bacterium]
MTGAVSSVPGKVGRAGLSRLVLFALGCVLLVAGILKGHHVWSNPGSLKTFDLTVAAAFADGVVGIWLVSGRKATWSWWASILLFSVYSGFTFVGTFQGREDCGCLGTLQVAPGWMLGFDIAALIALVYGRPRQSGAKLTTRYLYWTDMAAVIAFGVLVGIASGWAEKGRSQHRPTAEGVLVRGNRAMVSHGQVTVCSEDDAISLQLPVRNYWNTPLEITDIRPSCNCAKAELSSRRIEPLAEAKLNVTVTTPAGGKPHGFTCQLLASSGHQLMHSMTIVRYRLADLEDGSDFIVVPPLYRGQQRRLERTIYFTSGERLRTDDVALETDAAFLSAEIVRWLPSEWVPEANVWRTPAVLSLCAVGIVPPGLHRTNLMITIRASPAKNAVPFVKTATRSLAVTAVNNQPDVRTPRTSVGTPSLIKDAPTGSPRPQSEGWQRVYYSVVVEVKSYLKLEPESLFFQVAGDHGVRKANVVVHHAAEVPWRITSFQSTRPWLRVAGIDWINPWTALLRAEIDVTSLGESTHGEIVLQTDIVDDRRVAIPVWVARPGEQR